VIHIFDNGVKVYDRHLIPVQKERYKVRNVHEAEEEDIFVQLICLTQNNRACFISVGSAIGYYAILAKKLNPNIEVHAAEPLEIHRQWFIENIELNGLRIEDFVLYSEAVSNEEGYSKFVEAGYGSRIGNKVSNDESVKIVKTTTLDRIVKRLGKAVDLVQIDVQGLEVNVLLGSHYSIKNKNIKTFLIGTHGREIHQSCIEILSNSGYSIVFEIDKPQIQPDGIIVASILPERLKMITYFRRQ